MTEKAMWDDAHLKKLIEILREEVEKGNRPLGYLNKKGWETVLEKWEARTGKKYPKDKFKNKWDAIKNEYTWFMELKNEATGLGWDDAKRTVDCSKEWWDEHIKVGLAILFFIWHGSIWLHYLTCTLKSISEMPREYRKEMQSYEVQKTGTKAP